jgi:FkbM family methyltransferase
MKFYSQAKQDELLWHALFEHEPPDYFVDVGAHDGHTFSNTYALELAGWRGVCIEAHPDYIESLERNRPHSEIIHAAAGPQNLPSVTLYATPFGFLSSVDADELNTLDATQGYNSVGRYTIQIHMRRLDDILHDANTPCGFALLCIDTEGYEVEVLKGLTPSYWRPRIMLLEAYDAKHRTALGEYMSNIGYSCAAAIGVDLIYCRDVADIERVANYGAR